MNAISIYTLVVHLRIYPNTRTVNLAQDGLCFTVLLVPYLTGPSGELSCRPLAAVALTSSVASVQF